MYICMAYFRAVARYSEVVWPKSCSCKQVGGFGGILLMENFLIRHSEITSETIFGQKYLGKKDFIPSTLRGSVSQIVRVRSL